MVFRISISDEAQADFEMQNLYYRVAASKKVADSFAKALTEAKNSILENPFFQIRFNVFRAIPLKKFPFLIFYYIETDTNTIVIARIFRTSQNPDSYPQKK